MVIEEFSAVFNGFQKRGKPLKRLVLFAGGGSPG
jgi:hypothetical protein